MEQSPFIEKETTNEHQILRTIIENNDFHAKFLNTLSLLENMGARKISASEQLETVNLMVLKHAAEEHRHAFYLKKQLTKLGNDRCPTYADDFLLAPVVSRHYLQKLDIEASKYLKNKLGLSPHELRYAAYLLVTYAIELRADELYPRYQEELTAVSSKVNVKSIILEEQGHLEEMISQLKGFSSSWAEHAACIVKIEQLLYHEWMNHIGKAVI